MLRSVTRDTSPPEPSDLIRSVSRALRILEEVARADRPLSVKVLARRCALNLSTTYHLVRTLSYEGYVLRQPGGVYTVGPEVVGRFYELVASLHRPPRARVVLRHLAEVTGHTAYLARLDAGRVVVADLVEGPRSPYVEDLQVGLETAAHATALGKALLATVPTRQRRRWLAELGMRPFTVNTPTDPAQVDGELRGIGLGDIVLEHGQFRDDVCCAGAALPGDEPGGCWAIGVSSRAADMPEPVLVSLREAITDLAGPRA
jgi:DNA-binding IclR family transcriptional regulator